MDDVAKKIISSHLNIALLIENNIVRANIAYALRKKYDNVHIYDAGTASTSLKILQDEDLDVIISLVKFEGVPITSVIKSLRNTEGTKQFSIIMLLIYDTSDIDEYNLFDCGSDDIIIMPVSIKLIYDRLDNLEKNRKPFVVTRDYIGPDRRKSKRDDDKSEGPLVITAPNPISNKIKYNENAIKKQYEKFNNDMNDAKVKAYIKQLHWYSVKISDLQTIFDLNKLIEYAARTIEIISDLNNFTHKWNKSEVDTFIEELHKIINKILEENGHNPINNLEDLTKI